MVIITSKSRRRRRRRRRRRIRIYFPQRTMKIDIQQIISNSGGLPESSEIINAGYP